MPYILVPVTEKGKKGYKVCKRDEPKRCFSKHPLAKDIAEKQKIAITISEIKRGKKH
jgi:hypothetical protein